MDRGRLHRLAWALISPTALFSLLSILVYFTYRCLCTLRAQQESDGWLIGAWFYLQIEALTLFQASLPYVLRILAIRRPNRDKPILASADLPVIDILITCCNEDIDVILDTARAACCIDYPQDRFRVFICDDGASSEVKAAVEDMSYQHIFYYARVKGHVRDYKAGNLNAGLKYSKSVPMEIDASYDRVMLQNEYGTPQKRASVTKTTDIGKRSITSSSCAASGWSRKSSTAGTLSELSCSEYVAALDADMIPEPHWFKTILPYLIQDPKMGLVCPPQTFYDVPKNDILTQGMDHVASIYEVINDALGHADCTGSGYVVRRSAIEAIGGFPVQSLAEDICCSACLMGAGWKTAFVHEPLQYGSVPESLFAHIKQRTRWFVGHIQTAMMFRLRFFGARGKHLHWRQKLAGLVFDLSQLVQVPIVVAYFSIPFALICGHPLVHWTSTDELKNLIRLVATWLTCHWTHQAVMGVVAGIGNCRYDMRMPSWGSELDRWLAPYIAEGFLRSFILPKGWGGTVAGFTPSGSLKSDLHERNAHRRAPLHRRLYVMVFHQRVIIHVLFLLATLTGVIATFHRVFDHGTPVTSRRFPQDADKMVYLIARVGWPPLIWLQYVASAMCPILYVIFPPTTPDRESLLVRDAKTSAAYPSQRARRPERDWYNGWRFFRPAFAMFYTMVLFLASRNL